MECGKINALPLIYRLYGHQRCGAGDTFVIDLCRHLNIMWTSPLNRDANMRCILAAVKRKPDISRDVLAWALISVKFFDWLTIDGDSIIAGARRGLRSNENMSDIAL